MEKVIASNRVLDSALAWGWRYWGLGIGLTINLMSRPYPYDDQLYTVYQFTVALPLLYIYVNVPGGTYDGN